jgi:hypothetical protein
LIFLVQTYVDQGDLGSILVRSTLQTVKYLIPFKERGPQFIFQLLDLLKKRGLRNMRLLRLPGEATGIGDRAGVSELS